MRALYAVFALLAIAAPGLNAGVIFFDDFNSGASPLWGNESGAWVASGGVYDATAGTPWPNTHSFLPFNLTDFEVQVDVTTVGDGGVWLRAANAPATTLGATGMLLVIRPAGYSDMYWHEVADGSGYGAGLSVVPLLGAPHQIRVVVSGNTYSAYVDGAPTPATTWTSTLFSSGQTGLYGYAPSGFDNFQVSAGSSEIPEPATFSLAVLGIAFVALFRKRLVRRSN